MRSTPRSGRWLGLALASAQARGRLYLATYGQGIVRSPGPLAAIE